MANLSKASNVVQERYILYLLALLKSGIRFLSQPTVSHVILFKHDRRSRHP